MNLNSPCGILSRRSGNRSNLPDSFGAREAFGIDCAGQRLQAVKQSRRGSVEKFVPNAENASSKRCGRPLPTAFRNNLFQRHAVARAAPRSDNNFRVKPSNVLSGRLAARGAQELAASGLD